MSPRSWLSLLLVVHALLSGYSAWLHGPGWDEVGHLPAGLSYWRSGNTDMYRVNPPLARAVATLPLALLQLEVQDVNLDEGSAGRPEFDSGRKFWQVHGVEAYWYLTIARWMSIPWSLLAAGLIYLWASRLYGPEAGLFSATLWCFSPLVLTNGHLVAPDACAAAMGLAATITYWKWLQAPDMAGGYVAGVMLGLALLAKFSWIILPPLWLLIWGVAAVQKRQRQTTRERVWQAGSLATLMLVALLVINIGYGFEGSLRQLGDYRFLSQVLRGETGDSQVDNRFEGTWLGKLPVPLPENVVLGIDRQKLDFEHEMDSYLRGEWRKRGWWYYYAYGLLVKEPVGYLALSVIALLLATRRRISGEELVLLAPAVVLFIFVSSQTGFNHHLRYILPCLPLVFVWMGQVWRWAKSGRRAMAITAALAGWGVLSSLWVFPHSHAYFNYAVGGPMQGHHHLLDSNIDWGQDILPLARWATEHPEVELDGIAYSLDFLLDHAALGLPERKPPQGIPPDAELTREALLEKRAEGQGPQPGTYAVFVRDLRSVAGTYEYFRQFEPFEVLGYTVYLYELSESDVEDYWRELLSEE